MQRYLKYQHIMCFLLGYMLTFEHPCPMPHPETLFEFLNFKVRCNELGLPSLSSQTPLYVCVHLQDSLHCLRLWHWSLILMKLSITQTQIFQDVKTRLCSSLPRPYIPFLLEASLGEFEFVMKRSGLR